PRLRERIAKDILDSHPTFIQDILNLLVESTALHMLIVDAALSTPTFIDAVANLIVGNQTFIDEIKNAILNDSTLIQNLANQILDTISSLSMVDPEGNSIAEKDGGTFKFQAADHEQYGIVKGEANDSPSTWHLVSFINGLGSINREGLIDFIKTEIQNAGGVGGGGITYQDVIKILNQITLLGPDGLPIATNVEGMITVQQATPQQYGVVKPRKNSQLYPQAMSWYTMNRTLEADVKNDVHMFAPFAFPKCMPKRIEFFDKLTFIPINVEPDCGMSCKCCHNPNT
ncbi:MAG: hypothetical protein FWE95_11515, partial [Planctomycetaceae bacterium]|nr:hypothetical protein [Planctomycetaceae bacterium]